MADPCEVLGVAPDADEEQVRQRYLELVRSHPPDREPQRFAEIQAAYERLRDPEARLHALLFEAESDETLDDLLREASERVSRDRLPTDALLALEEDQT